jgi:anti-anti-sigma factor
MTTVTGTTPTTAILAPRRLIREVTAGLREHIHAEIDAAERLHSVVVIDLSSVELCDGNGLGVLVGARLRARAQGVSLIMATPSAALVRAARVTRLHRVLFTGSSSG